MGAMFARQRIGGKHQRFRGGLVLKAHVVCVSLSSRRASNKGGGDQFKALDALQPDEVCYKNALLLLVQIMLCSKFHCIEVLNLIRWETDQFEALDALQPDPPCSSFLLSFQVLDGP